VTASDGVHFVAAGYQNLAMRSKVCIRALLSAPPRPVKPSSHFWRGFKSPFGSKRALTAPTLSVRGRGGQAPQAQRLPPISQELISNNSRIVE
jgi:hypothetical protein